MAGSRQASPHVRRKAGNGSTLPNPAPAANSNAAGAFVNHTTRTCARRGEAEGAGFVLLRLFGGRVAIDLIVIERAHDRDSRVCTKALSILFQSALKIGAVTMPEPISVKLMAAYFLPFNIEFSWTVHILGLHYLE